jgi:PAS domain-containing protein
MERNLIRKLTGFNQYPSISILLPTHRTSPDNNIDAMLLKKLLREAETRLFAEFEKRKISGLISKLRKIIASIDIRHNLDGLAIYVNPRFEKIIRLPFPVKERVIIDDTFATRDIIRAMNRGLNYYTLSLSADFVRLFEAHRESFTEITESGFPFVNPFERGSNLDESTSQKEQRLKEFFNNVDKTFQKIYHNHPMNLVLAGVERNLSFYRKQADMKEIFITTVEGNYDHTSAHDLGKIVWPLVKETMSVKRRKVIKQMEEALGVKKLVSGIEEVWNLAIQNRGQILVVEEDYRQAAIIHPADNSVTFTDESDKPGVTDDLVDEIAEKVISTGGRVVFVDNGALKKYDRIGLILKY